VIVLTVLLNIEKGISAESLVIMVIKCNLIIVAEQIVPECGLEPIGVMEDKVCLRGIELNHLSHLSVEVLQLVDWSVPPWGVHWFKTTKCGMSTPSGQDLLGDLQSSLHVYKIDVAILLGSCVEFRDPSWVLVIPM